MGQASVELVIQLLDQRRPLGNQFAMVEVENPNHHVRIRRAVPEYESIGGKRKTSLAGFFRHGVDILNIPSF